MFKSLKAPAQGPAVAEALSPDQVLAALDFSAGLGEVSAAQAEATQSRRVVQYLKDGGSAEAVVALFSPSGPTPALEAFQDGSAAALTDLFERNAEASDVAATEGLNQWARRNRKSVSILTGILAAIVAHKVGLGRAGLTGIAAGAVSGMYLTVTKNAADPCPASRQDFDEAFSRIRSAVDIVKHITADVTKKDEASIPERVVFHQCDFGKSGLNTAAAYKSLIDELQTVAKSALDALTAAEHKFGAMADPIPSDVATQYSSAVSAISESISEVRAHAATIGQKFFAKSKDAATK